MKVYQVGGSVRDFLLERTSHDKDFVVVDSSIDEMLSLGYTQIGKNFPVFLHPETKQEYALARKEICIGDKHTDFQCNTKEITLEEDLIRRDLTINAIALDDNGNLIDLFNGINDLNNKILRHISEHFVEDPLRVLRVARFAAQLDFQVAPETIELCKKININELSRERVVDEIKKAFAPNCNSKKFIQFLDMFGHLGFVFPNLIKLKQSIEYSKFHTEPNTFEHVLNVLDYARDEDYLVKIACLYHDIGKQDFCNTYDKKYHTDEQRVEKYLSILKPALLLSNQNYRKIKNAVIEHHIIREVRKEFYNNNFINSGDYDFALKVSNYDKATHKTIEPI